jgi:Skp family chaperone for outer membrane proteins
MFLKYIKIFLIFLILNYPNSSMSNSYPIYKNASSIAILDQDSLFSKSIWGQNVLENVEKLLAELALENRSIEKELESEELNLTELRKTKSKSDFDILALKFDKKVKQIRTIQSDKKIQINTFLNKSRSRFFEKVTPILLELIAELGVEVLLNKDTVALASLGSDITNVAIIRINSKLNLE